MSTTTAVTSTSTWLSPEPQVFRAFEGPYGEMPLGGIRNHGEYRSHLRLKKYQSIQASINPVASRYRRAGQVTGLLFRSSGDKDYPDLLGQYSGTGASFDLGEGEHIVDLKVTTIKPIRQERFQIGLSQVDGVIVITNRRRICWNATIAGACEREMAGLDHEIREATWEFSAMYDRVKCIY